MLVGQSHQDTQAGLNGINAKVDPSMNGSQAGGGGAQGGQSLLDALSKMGQKNSTGQPNPVPGAQQPPAQGGTSPAQANLGASLMNLFQGQSQQGG
jgi:hypothetical protein